MAAYLFRNHRAHVRYLQNCSYWIPKEISKPCFIVKSRCISTSQPKKTKWSYTSGPSEVPLIGTTIGSQLQLRAEENPDKDALVFFKDGIKLTFSQLLQKADSFAANLMSLGLKQGDRVGIWGPNTEEWVITQYGTARAGIILVNVNPSYRLLELKYALKKSGCKALVAAPGFRESDYMSMIKEIIPDLESKQHRERLNCSELPDLHHIITMGDALHTNCLRFSDLLTAATPSQLSHIFDLQDKFQFDDPINIQFTSGTTGSPKGACLTHHNILNNSYFVGRRCGYHEHDGIICAPVPLYHCFGMVMACLQIVTHGAKVVWPSPVFDPGYTLQAVEAFGCTSLYGVPTMFIDMLNHPRCSQTDCSTLITGIMAGSPCPIETMKDVVNELNIKKMTVCYGSTETSPVTFQSLGDCPIEKRVSTIGQVSDHTEAKIIDSEGKVVPIGETGEVCTRGTSTMRGYWDDEEKTRGVISPTRWYHTGDLGVMTEDGYVSIVGRIKDMVIRGGENIYPLEIEQHLYEHDFIKDVQVVGVPDKRLGEQLCAWIVIKENCTLTEREVKDFCKPRMASYKIPKYILFVESFPVTVTGKIQKYIMREESVKLLGEKLSI